MMGRPVLLLALLATTALAADPGELERLRAENARLTERALEQEKLRRDLALAAEVQNDRCRRRPRAAAPPPLRRSHFRRGR